MKSTGEVYSLARGETCLRIDDECSRSLRLTENSVLYVVGLAERALATDGTSTPGDARVGDDVVIVASPYPTSSWNNLFRASFILPRKTGMLHQLLAKLNDLRIFCRSIEMTGSLPLHKVGFLSHTLPLDRILGGAKTETMVPATVVLVLEVPDESKIEAMSVVEVGDGRDEQLLARAKAKAQELKALHEVIRAMLQWSPPRTTDAKHPEFPTARNKLQENLGTSGIIVEWTSTMRTTREISRLWKDPRLARVKAALQRPNATPEMKQLLGEIEVDIEKNIAERGLEKMRELVHRDEGGLYVDAGEWRGDIWRSDRDFKDTGHTARVRTADKLVITHADSDERIVYWYVRSLRERCFVEFTITFPSGGMESAWCEWITDVIHKNGKGIILSAQLSARGEPESDRLQIRGGRWASLRLLVEFSEIKDTASANEVIQCFVELQGKCTYPAPNKKTDQDLGEPISWDKHIQDFLEDHRYIKDLLPAPEHGSNVGKAGRWRAGTLVSHVQVWYEQHLDALHQIEFWSWQNLFNFTAPHEAALRRPDSVPHGMDEWGSRQIESKRGGPSRETLARRVVEALQGRAAIVGALPTGGRVAIVGAHRSGKTSVLRLLRDHLLELPRDKDTLWLPVLIDAGICPPVQLCVEILRKIRDGSSSPRAVRAVTELSSLAVAEAAKKEVEDLEDNLEALERLFERLSPDKASPGPLGQRDKFLRDSRDALRNFLRLKFQGRRPRIAVMVDGIAARGAWMEPWAQAFWRELVEASELAGISWVITTSQPLGETVPHSSISSVFCEYSLEPLDEYETDLLINQIDTPPNDSNLSGAELLPVLTLSARRFLAWVSARMPYLLQVCCHCLFERARRMRVPLLCTRVAVEVLDGEVLPQLTDYLEAEWGRLPEEARRHVLLALEQWPEDPREMLFTKTMAASTQFAVAPPAVQKALRRSGLIGDPEFGLVAPLVAFWLRRSRRHSGPA